MIEHKGAQISGIVIQPRRKATAPREPGHQHRGQFYISSTEHLIISWSE